MGECFQNMTMNAVNDIPAVRTISEQVTMDANEATASVAYRMNDAFAIYPITPSTPMAEQIDEWSARKRKNLWGQVPQLMEMQSEGGAAGALHGLLQGGTLASSFTSSQGLLLMIPNMYKIAGELTPFCLHVAARALATHALSIFGDHSDVMACRQTGFAMLSSGSPQEAQDFAAIAQAVTLKTRVPFMHFFDGFRTSHEVNAVMPLEDDVLRAMMDDAAVLAHRARRLSSDRPVLRGTAQNPDVFFQAREGINRYYDCVPGAVQEAMEKFAELTGRAYRIFEYEGDPEAEKVIVIMGSGGETVAETAIALNSDGEKTGVLRVRLFRPFSVSDCLAALPETVRKIAVLDRTKEPGSVGEPLYLDVATALREGDRAEVRVVIGGRYGLGSKEFTPAMVKAVFDELDKSQPKNHFSVGIVDDVTRRSLEVDDTFEIEPAEVRRAMFYGLGSDGTVGANKNTVKIIGEETENYAQGYFVYDSKKSGAMTISHLRFSPKPIRAPYLIRTADFVACHHFPFLQQFDVLSCAAHGATFLLNAPGPMDKLWSRLPKEVQAEIVEKELKVYAIDAYKVARDVGLGGRTNTLMQTCFFALSGILPRETALAKIKESIEKTYGSKGRQVVEKNTAAVDSAIDAMCEIKVPADALNGRIRPPAVAEEAPEFVQRVTSMMLANKGDLLPVSAFPVDGTWPTATSRWEKRNLATEIPVWDPDICIQCNKCVMVCPHATIRAKFYEPDKLDGAPASFKSTAFRSKEFPDRLYTLQVAPEDCTGCRLCVEICPAKDKSQPNRKAINMEPQQEIVARERENYGFFLNLPSPDRTKLSADVKHTQFLDPLFEYSGACAGCGETPYVKLLSQLFGDRSVIANATGCSSIYGGNLPTTPYTVDAEGRGPAWSNSLFEDNAEFGLGLRLSIDHHVTEVRSMLPRHASELGEDLVSELLNADQRTEEGIAAQRARVKRLRERLDRLPESERTWLDSLSDFLVKKNVWIVGGDGWAYDIGYGGLDHVISTGKDVNILVLDTEVYSNTGGQCSKSTPLGASAKFSVGGKNLPKKDLGLIAMTYGSVYVARVAMGARDVQTVQAFREAESFPGPSIIIAYSHCIAHGYNLVNGLSQQKLAVQSGAWPIFRYDPRRADKGMPPMQLDSKKPTVSLADYTANELRFRVAGRTNPELAKAMAEEAQKNVTAHQHLYEKLAEASFGASLSVSANGNGDAPPAKG